MTQAPDRKPTPAAFTRETQRKLTMLRVTAYGLATCFMIVMVIRGVWITRNQLEAEVDRSVAAAAIVLEPVASAGASAGPVDRSRPLAAVQALAPPGVTFRLAAPPGVPAAPDGDGPALRTVTAANGKLQLVARIDHAAIWNSALRTNLPFMLFVLALGLPTVVIFLYMGWLVNRPALLLLGFAQSGGGEASDPAETDALTTIPVTAPKALLADKGYDGDAFRQNLLMHGILPIIPPRSNRKAPEHPDYRRYRDRNCIEPMFGKVKQQRRIATRYDKTALSFTSFLNLAAARLWLKSFVNAA